MPVQVQQLFDKIHSIPQIPEVVRVLITEFNNPKVDFKAITENIQKEQVISLKVLRLVNSAHFGLSKKIGTIQEAVIMLGMNQLRTLVIASGMTSAISKVDGIDLKAFWADSFRTATYAKWLAAESKLAPDLAFTAGLISNFGRVLIFMGLPSLANEVEQHVRSGHDRATIEMNRLGFTSEHVCAELCRRWHFSKELTNAVAESYAPLQAANPDKNACIVHLARYLSQAMAEDKSAEQCLESFPVAEAEYLGFNQTYLAEQLPTLLALKSGLEGLEE